MIPAIKRLEQLFQYQTGLAKLWTGFQLYIVFIVFAIHRAIVLLFASPQRSFALIAEQNGRGVWTGSYLKHQQYQRQMRMMSFSGFAILILASVVAFSATQLLYPERVEKAFAATSTFTVSNGDVSGAGSLSQAISDCNDAAPNDCIIELDNASTVSVPLEGSTLSLFNKATFQNLGADTDLIIDGSSLSADMPCLHFRDGSQGSVVSGIEFRSCPVGVAMWDDQMTIGTGSGESGRVYFSASTRAISWGGPSVDTFTGLTIQNTRLGQQNDGTLSGSSDGIYIVTATSDIYNDITLNNIVANGWTEDSPNIIISNSSDSFGQIQTVSLSDITMAGSSNTQLLSLKGVDGFTIDDVSIENQGEGALALSLDLVANGTVTSSTFSDDVYVGGAGTSNIQIGASSPSGIAADGNVIGGGIEFGQPSNHTIQAAYNTSFGHGLSTAIPLLSYYPAEPSFSLSTLRSYGGSEQRITADAGTTGKAYFFQAGEYIGEITVGPGETTFEATATNLTGTLVDGQVLQVYPADSNGIPGAAKSMLVGDNPEETDEDEGDDGFDPQETVTTTTTTATFTFTTLEQFGKARVYIGTSQAAADAETTASASESEFTSGQRSLTITGLTPGTTYFYSFRFIVQDEEGGEGSEEEQAVSTGTFTTTELPVDENPQVTPTISTTTTSATFEFSSSQSLKPRLFVATTSAGVSSATPVTGTFGVSHELTKSGLTPDTVYHYAIYADVNGDDATYTLANDGTFRTDSNATITDLDDDYLQEWATVDEQVVYDPSEKLYLGPGSVDLLLENATKGHDIKYEVKEEESTDIVLDVDWKAVTKNTIQQKFTGLQQGVVYIIRAKVRQTDDTTKEDTFKKVTTIQKTDRDAPAYTTYNGGVVVTAEPILEMGGDLEGMAGRVILQDVYSGRTVSSCNIPKGQSLCNLVPRPLPGDYRVQFASVKSDTPSAPDQMLLTITEQTPTTVLYADRNNPFFKRRIVTANTVKVAGASTLDVDIDIYVDGQKIKTIFREDTTDVGWSFDVILTGFGHGNHIIRAVEQRRDGSGKFKSRIDIPFVYSGPVRPVTTNLQSAYLRGSNASIQLQGAANNVTSVYVDGTFLINVTLASTGGGNGAGTFSLPTGVLGNHSVSFVTRNEIGLRSAEQVFGYRVYVPVVDDGNCNTNGTCPDENVNTPVPNGNTNTPCEGANCNGNQNENDNGNENINVPDNQNDNTNAPCTVNCNDNGNNNQNTNVPCEDGNCNGNGNTNTPNGNTNTDDGFVAPELHTPAELDSPVAYEDLPDSVKDLIKPDLQSASTIIIDQSVIDLAVVPDEYKITETDPEKRTAIVNALRGALERALSVIPFKEIEFVRTGEVKRENIEVAVADGVTLFPQRKIIGLPQVRKRTQETYGVQITGNAVPYALVKATLRSTPIVKVTRANANGEWTMGVPANALSNGRHTAYLQTESRGVKTDNNSIANFVIVQNQYLSNTTWAVIITLAVAGVILILVLGMQLGHKDRNGGNRYGNGKNGGTGGSDGYREDDLQGNMMIPSAVLTEAREQQGGVAHTGGVNAEDQSTRHGALSI